MVSRRIERFLANHILNTDDGGKKGTICTFLALFNRECNYIPYFLIFLFQTLCVFLDMVLIIALLTYRSDLLFHRRPEISEIKEPEIASLSLIYAVFVTISAFLNIYFFWVVWRAKKYYNQVPGIQSSVYHLRGSRPYEPDLFGLNIEQNQRLIL